MRTRCIGIAIGAGLAVSATAQTSSGRLGAAGGLVTTMRADEAGGVGGIRGPVVASLTYDGVNNYGFKGQDFESVFDLYDVYVCETFSISADATVLDLMILG